MPDWLCRQITQAYFCKDIYRIKLLNEFWFSYIEKENKQTKISL